MKALSRILPAGRSTVSMLRPRARHLGIALAFAATVSACRGSKSEDAPVHLVSDMDWQPRAEAQEASSMFADGRAMRPLVEGTIPVGYLKADDAFYRGKNGDEFIERIPLQVNRDLIDRGQERFNIYCAPCHDEAGSGRGMVVQRGYPPPLDLASDRVKNEMPDGEIFNVISNGVRNMPAYRTQIPEADRWAIVAWVRVLGRSQGASIDDVPKDQRGSIQEETE